MSDWEIIWPATADALFGEAQRLDLFQQLLAQLSKDFGLANEPIDFPKSTSPQDLKIQLEEKIHRMLYHRFAEYLNLLYIIDVPEKDIKALDGSDLAMLSESVTFLILKREWQKVWFRNHFR